MQLINIKYQVDKSDVEKSNQSVQKAKDLTEQLKKSTKSQSDQAKKSNRDYQGSIEGVRLKMQQLKALIDLTAQSDRKRLNELIKQYQQAKKQIDDFNKSLKVQSQNTQQAVQTTNNLAGGFVSMYNAIKLVIGAQFVRELVSVTLEAAKLSGQVEGVTRAFNRLPGAETLLINLRRVTKGTVTDLELMQKSLMAQNYRIPLENLGTLLEFAAAKAQQTGQEVNHLVNYIVTGIGLRSIKRLDDLGFTANRVNEALGGVSLQAASMAQVMDAVSKLMNEDLEKTGGLIETSKTKVEQLEVAWHELKVELAKKLESNGVLNFFDDVLKGAKTVIQAFPDITWENFIPGYGVVKGVNDFRSNLQELTKQNVALKQAEEEYTKFVKRANEEKENALRLAQLQIVANVEMINRNKEEIRSFKERNEILKENSRVNAVQIEENNKAIRFYDVQILKLDKVNGFLKDYISNTIAVNEQIKEELGLIGELQIRIDDLEAKRDTSRSTAEITKLNRQLEILKGELHDLQKLGLPEFKVKELKTEPIKNASDEFGKMADVTARVDKNIQAIIDGTLKLTPAAKSFADVRSEVEKAFSAYRDNLLIGSVDLVASQLQSITDIEVFNYEQRLVNLRAFYDAQYALAGDNERARKEISIREQRDTIKAERDLAIKQRQARLYSIAIDTAASIAKAWVNPGFPGAIPLSAFLVAQGAAQAAIVQRAPLGFKDGVIDLKGPGTSTSDSIRANLSRGESVMTAKETQASKGILTAIRAKKLDDQKLARMAAANGAGRDGGVFDASGIIQATKRVEKAIASNDIVRKGGIIYDAKKEGDNFTTYMRSKNLRG